MIKLAGTRVSRRLISWIPGTTERPTLSVVVSRIEVEFTMVIHRTIKENPTMNLRCCLVSCKN